MKLFNEDLLEIAKKYIDYFTKHYKILFKVNSRDDLLKVKNSNLGIVSEWLKETDYMDKILSYDIDLIKELPENYKFEGLTLKDYYLNFISKRKVIFDFDYEYGDFQSMFTSFTEFITSIYRFKKEFN